MSIPCQPFIYAIHDKVFVSKYERLWAGKILGQFRVSRFKRYIVELEDPGYFTVDAAVPVSTANVEKIASLESVEDPVMRPMTKEEQEVGTRLGKNQDFLHENNLVRYSQRSINLKMIKDKEYEKRHPQNLGTEEGDESSRKRKTQPPKKFVPTTESKPKLSEDAKDAEDRAAKLSKKRKADAPRPYFLIIPATVHSLLLRDFDNIHNKRVR